MDFSNPLQLQAFFDIHTDLPREAPGSEASTLRALSYVQDRLPNAPRIADMGSGPGSSALPLAKALPGAHVFAFDLHEPFVMDAAKRAGEAGLKDRFFARAGDMMNPLLDEASLDLIWCEGAIYNCGVEAALSRWTTYLKPSAPVVFSEVIWRVPESERPTEITEHWAEYPDMTDHKGVVTSIERAGYSLLASFDQPETDWEAYFAPIEERLPMLEARFKDKPSALIPIQEQKHEIKMRRQYCSTFDYRFYIVTS